MKRITLFTSLLVFCLIASACNQTGTNPMVVEKTEAPITAAPTEAPATAAPTEVPQPTEEPTPAPTRELTADWSTTAGTKDELSFAFPGEWDGSSPLTFGEGEFVKHPDLSLGVTFRIELQGDPADLLADWGSDTVGVVGIATFAPEVVTDGPEVTIARIVCPTRIAEGEGVTGQVAYIQRDNDVMEVMWFAPTEQWNAMQETFTALLERIEIWRVYSDMTLGLHTMYVHDWQAPAQPPEGSGLWFKSADGNTGLLLTVINEIADPLEYLNAWNAEELAVLELSDCTLNEGDRMDVMGGQWESRSGECTKAGGTPMTYEVAYIPDKDRLLEMVTYAPTETWADANRVAFKHLLGMLTDLRP